MKTQSKNRTAEIKVRAQWTDTDNICYDCIAYATINYIYEVEEIRFSVIEAFDQNGEAIEGELSLNIKTQLEAVVGAKALEKAQPEDFATECGRE